MLDNSWIDYNEFERAIADSFRRQNQSKPLTVRMIGLLFTRPGTKLFRESLDPNRSYFNLRSGDHIDFLWPGWITRHADNPGDAGTFHLFSDEQFVKSVRVIESHTCWTYSEQSDLILCNAHRTNATGDGRVDWSSVVVCQLDEMLKVGAITSVESFFGDIFRYAESSQGEDPTWGFSDRKAIHDSGSTLKRLLLSLVPKEVAESARRLEHFAVRDVGKALA